MENPVEQGWDPKGTDTCVEGKDFGKWSVDILDEYFLNRHSQKKFTEFFKPNGFNGIMFDIEEILIGVCNSGSKPEGSQPDGTPCPQDKFCGLCPSSDSSCVPPRCVPTKGGLDAVISKFKEVFKMAAHAGLLVAIAPSWCGPYHNSHAQHEIFRKAFAADNNVHMWVPQLYELGNETFEHWNTPPRQCTAEVCYGCTASFWKEMFSNPNQAIAVAIPKSGQYSKWKGWLNQMDPSLGNRVKGYFQWLQPSYAEYEKARVLLA